MEKILIIKQKKSIKRIVAFGSAKHSFDANDGGLN
jgi:hypothetical protein